MTTLLAVVHIFIAIILITLVLIQDSKDGGAGGVFGGGGSNSVLSTSGANNLLVRMTRFFAFGFAATCVGLTIITTRHGSSVMEGVVPPPAAAPVVPVQAPAPENQTDGKTNNSAAPKTDVDKK